MTEKWKIEHTLTVIGFIIIVFGILYNGITINQNKILIEDLNETVKIKHAEIEHLKAKIIDANITFDQIIDFPVACSEGCAISHINFSGRHTVCSCFD